MRVTSKGQVTIPIEMRRKYGIKPDMEVEFVDGDTGPQIVVKRNAPRRPSIVSEGERSDRAERMLRRMRQAPWQSDLTTDELMSLLRGWDDEDEHVTR